jgi:hypothetical protein
MKDLVEEAFRRLIEIELESRGIDPDDIPEIKLPNS